MNGILYTPLVCSVDDSITANPNLIREVIRMARITTVQWSHLSAASTPIPSTHIPEFGGGNVSLWPDILNLADWAAAGVIVVVGGMWMFGNRSVALARLIDGCIGYLIIHHARDILSWLKQM